VTKREIKRRTRRQTTQRRT